MSYPPEAAPTFETIKIVGGVIQKEMDLNPDKVFLYNQDADLGSYSGIYVNIGILGDKPFGASLNYVSDPTLGLLQNQSVNLLEIYSILISSKDASARQRRHEIIFALNSQRMQQAMEQYSFKIGNLPTTMNDVSEVEETYRLNRYSLTFNCTTVYGRIRAVDYYNKLDPKNPSLLINP